MKGNRFSLRGAALSLASATVLLGAFAAPAIAAPPNDDFANAELVGPGLPIDVDGTTVDATAQVDEPEHGSFGGPETTIWYQWVASVTGPVEVDTCASEDFPLVAIYTGTALNALTSVADSDQDCTVSFPATMGQSYKIAIETFGETTGDVGPTNLLIVALTPPANDDFDNAQVIGPTLPISVTGTNEASSAEAGEPDDPFGQPGEASVWYSWAPATSGAVTIDVCDSDFDTTLGVFTGAALPLTEVAQNDDTPNCGVFELGSKVTLNAVAGTAYSIAVSGLGGFEGTFTLAVNAVPVVVTPTPPATTPPAPVAPTCKKGQKLKKGKCVKKKKKKKKGK